MTLIARENTNMKKDVTHTSAFVFVTCVFVLCIFVRISPTYGGGYYIEEICNGNVTVVYTGKKKNEIQ